MAVLTILFFMWGFVTCLNDILIPHFRDSFNLTYFQSSLVQFSFFGAYFIGSLIYFLFSSATGDPINRMGYKNGIISGLLISAIGTALFYPAASLSSYGFFLAALFVLGLGFTLLQIAANPYVAIIGPEETASNRLNLAQAFNSFGTTIAPLIGGTLILTAAGTGLSSVQLPYVFIACIFIGLIILFRFTHLPAFENLEQTERGAPALKYPQLTLGVLAIFFYVGGEVSTGSFLTSFAGLSEIKGLSPENATGYVALYWGSLMIGRFAGAIRVFKMSQSRRNALLLLVPAVTFAVILAMIKFNGQAAEGMVGYMPYILIAVVAFFMPDYSPSRMLSVGALLGIVALIVALNSTGSLALWMIVSLGLFNSVMWPLIFTLAIQGLGRHTSQGSSLLVMAILGGALIPPVQGWLADGYGVHQSYIVPLVCYIYIAFYGWKVAKLNPAHHGK